MAIYNVYTQSFISGYEEVHVPALKPKPFDDHEVSEKQTVIVTDVVDHTLTLQ